ncbi:hypothetical protein IZ6_10770 [Terrihabitans soli]|uniref:Uncharacterized protein n=1 Tax=Terrihabitans soli TaxID=708113 RepID=A0A6S6QSU9_9HYPH|nr:hypothetical protein [Terrihabitans soli]BCJ90342.1 hypothetical protein IZ6_10770 [Terrihabitans soli]
MKAVLALAVIAGFAASPVLAQTTNDSNLKPQSDVVKGAEKSAEPGMAAPSTGEKAAPGSTSNSGNLKPQSDTVKGAAESSKPTGAMDAPVTPSTKAGGSDTNSGNLKQ